MNAPAPSEGAKRITFLLGRLTVLRGFLGTPPVAKLYELCDALSQGDGATAAMKYHAMTGELLEQGSRRVSGDIWKDFVFSELLETPNRFSLLAARGQMDPPVQQSMAHDLRLMQELFALNCDTILLWIGRLTKERSAEPVRNATKPMAVDKKGNRADSETIERMATSAWSGGAPLRDRQKAKTSELQEHVELPPELEMDRWIRWGYDEPGEHVEYVADEGLAIIYRRFLAEKDWGTLCDALLDFHARYGCGQFLRNRVFLATDDGLQGVAETDAPEWDELVGLGRQKERLYANTLRFLHTGRGENVLLYGADGMGKTSLVLSLTRELADLRLILMTQREFSASMETLRTLQGQPFRIIALFDDLNLSEREYRRLKAALTVQPGHSNALIIATSSTPAGDGSIFGLEIPFASLEPGEFVALVEDLVRRENPSVNRDAVRNACQQWHGEREDTSIRAAKRVAQTLLRQVRR